MRLSIRGCSWKALKEGTSECYRMKADMGIARLRGKERF